MPPAHSGSTCALCEGDGEVAAYFNLDSTERPEIRTCPDCAGSGVGPLGGQSEVAILREALTVLRDACGHCLAAGRPPNQQMIDGADAALRGEWTLTP